MRIVFFGTPAFSLAFLQDLYKHPQIDIAAIVAQPDTHIGRKKVLTSPPTISFAKEQNIPYFQPNRVKGNEAFLEELRSLQADAYVVIAYGHILPKALLAIPTLGTINLHPSLLPELRGPAPMQAAIALQKKQTGVSVMVLDEKMDHGPILSQNIIDIDATETYTSLEKKVIATGSIQLQETLLSYAAGEITAQDQHHEDATFCSLIKKEDGQVNWNESAEAIEAKFRAYELWPGTYTFMNHKRVKLLQICIHENATLPAAHIEITEDHHLLIGTGTKAIKIIEVQPEGKQSMTAKAYIQGLQESLTITNP